MVDPEVILWTSMKGVVQDYSTNRKIILKWEQNKLWDDTLLNLSEEYLHIGQICYRIGSTTAVKIGQLCANADIFMTIYFADALGVAIEI